MNSYIAKLNQTNATRSAKAEDTPPYTPGREHEPEEPDQQQTDRSVRQSAAQVDRRQGQALLVEEQSAREPRRGHAERHDEPPTQLSPPVVAVGFDDGKLWAMQA